MNNEEKLARKLSYVGPHVPSVGLQRGTTMIGGIHKNIEAAIAECPAIRELFVPIEQLAAVRRELDFNIAHEMRGTSGRYVMLFREVQNWMKNRKQPKTIKPITIIEETHHA